VKALAYLEEQGDIELRAAGVREGFRVVKRPDDVRRLGAELQRRFETRERNDLGRLGAVTDLLAEPGCIVRRLLAHFGEELGRDCGHCGACAGDVPVALRRPARSRIVVPFAMETLRREQPRALGTPRQVARFLCGISSPALSAAKLPRHVLFGRLGDVPFADVLRAVSTASKPRSPGPGSAEVKEEPAGYGDVAPARREPALAAAMFDLDPLAGRRF
jgi:ATP-dependent DNA helicase RecQ